HDVRPNHHHDARRVPPPAQPRRAQPRLPRREKNEVSFLVPPEKAMEVEKIHLTGSNTMHRKCQFQALKKAQKIGDFRATNDADSWASLKNLETESGPTCYKNTMTPDEMVRAACSLVEGRKREGKRFFVAIDGGAGAGKSMLARGIHDNLKSVSILRTDDFFRPLNEHPIARMAPEKLYE